MSSIAFSSSDGCNFDWAWHHWDMSSTSAFSLSFLSLFDYFFLPFCLRIKPSAVCWWSQACWLEPVRLHSRTQLALNVALFWLQNLLGPHLSRTLYFWNLSCFTLMHGELNRYQWVALWIKLSYHMSNKIVHLCVFQPPPLTKGKEAGEDARDWEATVRTCQRKLGRFLDHGPTDWKTGIEGETPELSLAMCGGKKSLPLAFF